MSETITYEKRLPVDSPELSLLQFSTLDGISQAQTSGQIARQLGVERNDVKQAEQEVVDFFGAMNPAHATHLAIQRRILAVGTETGGRTGDSVTESERKLLGVVANGVSNAQLAQAANVKTERVRQRISSLEQKVGAWSRAHMVRRSYELGILATAGEA